jgi:hypothetical protein
MPGDLYGPNYAARALLDYEERLAAGEWRDAEVGRAFAQLIVEIRNDPDAYVADWVADPAGLLAQLYRLCAESTGNEAELGRLVLRSAFLPQVRAVASLKADRSR